jgi:hypothetical protein
VPLLPLFDHGIKAKGADRYGFQCGTFIGVSLLSRRADRVNCIRIVETIQSWIKPSLDIRWSGRFGKLSLLSLALSLGASKLSARGRGLGSQNP